MVHNKRIFIVFVVICLLSVVSFYAFGVSVSKNIGVEILEETYLPHELNFKIQSECTGHSFFNQATVQEDGAFAVHTFGVVDDKSWTNFEYNFIDIYDSSGNFLKEMTFESKENVAIELVDSTLNIYFYSSVVCYDLKTEDLHYYIVSDGAALDNGVIERLRAEKFKVGKWTYYYKECFEGYTKLLRTDGEIVETILERPGRDKTNLYTGTVIGVSGFLGGCGYLIWKKKNKQDKSGYRVQ